ncbi:UvrD-helicase domain-containing protein [Shewanella goraebulensis]|uniref:UvrD-helicase domain-containing protein n=1 Tax=Shewanella goraebulensis TaxID=3050637 RepID=UPI00254CC11D|nr:UvrD-helicase domain-containing protein [Shewanella goraebulensis]
MTAVEMPKVAIAGDFLSAFAKIPKKQQKKVQEFISKFRQNPTSTGINYEKIVNAKSKGVHSVRIDQAYRGIVFKPEKGNVYMLMWVDRHDDAYTWAERHECMIHPSTGGIQIVDVSHVEAKEPEQPHISKSVKHALFKEYSSEQISALGVPESFLSAVLAVTSEAELERLESRLPVEAYEPLYLLSTGEDYDEVVASYNDATDEVIDTEDFAAALDRASTQRNFKLVTDDLELQKMLNAPLEKWRVFLHPCQQKLVSKEAKGPIRVLGGAGTGKTVVAMHRAVYLAQQLSGAEQSKVLLTTFTKNLASDIEANLCKIASEDELSRIEVTNIDGWVTRFLKRFNYDFKVVYENDETRRKCWNYALDQAPSSLGYQDSFYEEEWRHIVQLNDIKSKAEYFHVSRLGRGTALSRMERAKVWPVFEEFRNQMNRHRIRDMNDAMLDATKIIQKQNISLPYSSVVVDEGQDIGRQAFMLLRALVPEQNNDMFIVGDGHQRIYRNKVVLGQCGINVRGRRSQKLRINYRTTEETRRFATAILQDVKVDDLDGEMDKSTDYLSLYHGEKPIVSMNKDFESELQFIKNNIDNLIAQDVELKDICLVGRTNYVRDNYAKSLNELGIDTYALSANNSDGSKPGLRVATMHRVKGLEFKYIFIAAVNDGVIPLCKVNTNDPVESRDYDFNERALLHVAATRAITGLFVTSSGSPSPYIRSFGSNDIMTAH